MKKEEVDLFEKIYAQLESLHYEITVLSKKSPNDALNKFKLKFINRTLEGANKILEGKYKPFPEFGLFEEDDLPSNSDVTMVLSQYLTCMEKLRADNITSTEGYTGGEPVKEWYWIIGGKESNIKTSPPKKLKS